MDVWPGMTIQDILEKVDLLNFDPDSGISDQKLGKEGSPEWFSLKEKTPEPEKRSGGQAVDPSSAYLGPRLWSKPITLEDLMDEEPTATISIPEFLGSEEEEAAQSPMWTDSPVSPPTLQDTKPVVMTRPSIIVAPKKPAAPAANVKITVELPKGDNQFLYVESKKARIEREKAEKKRKFEVDMDFAPEDLALATVPGMDFDPKQRSFDIEELKPQPIIRKRRKMAVPEEMKDDRYWEKRSKNKEATRRSREARRLKENQIALRAAFLEKENRVMRKELEDSNFQKTKLETEIDILKKKLEQYQQFC